MGITNLLKELRPITQNITLSLLSGQKCGVDASCWLHRAAHSCALKLVSNKPTTAYLKFTLNCIKLLQYWKITPIIVFDGAQLPMKANEELKRNSVRDKNKRETLKYIKAGDHSNAWKHAQMAVRITREMVTQFMNQCIENNIQFVCAPYEADSQLGYMYKNGDIDFVITEDSDLLLFGVRKALYKFDVKKASGDFVNMDKIGEYKPNRNVADRKRKMDLCLFLKKYWFKKDVCEFIRVCVLSGCDYVDNLPGIGLKTAVKYCTDFRRVDFLLQKVMSEKWESAPKDYKIQFKRAVLTFLHQTVYDINTKKVTYLNPLSSNLNVYFEELKRYLSRNNGENSVVYDDSLHFLGKPVDDLTAVGIAEGKIDARSLKKRNLVTNVDRNINMNVDNDNDNNNNENSNRFFASSSVSSSKAKAKTKNINNIFRNRTTRTRRQNKRVKEKKYFGCNDNDNRMELEGDDGLQSNLDDMMTQFGYTGTNNNNNHNNHNNHNNNDLNDMNFNEFNWDNTEDTEFAVSNFDEKDENENEIEIIVANSDEEEEENLDNKPLQRPHKNRKRKRSAMNEYPLKNINNTNTQKQKRLRRKLNNGRITQKHDDLCNDMNNMNNMTTPSNKFIARRTPTNIETPSNMNNDSLISDLFSGKKRKTKTNIYNSTNKENITKSSHKKRINNNPFSIKHKKTKSLAINMSDHESESDDIDMERDRKHKLLPYSIAQNNTNNTNNNGNNCNDDIFNDFGDEVSELNDGNGRVYSQLSQSQSEQQMEDMAKDFRIYSQSQSQESDEIKEVTDNDEDDDIEIIANPKQENRKKIIPVRKPKFKTPKFKNGPPPMKKNMKKIAIKNSNSKKKINIKTKVSAKKKRKIKKKSSIASNQATLHAFWKTK